MPTPEVEIDPVTLALELDSAWEAAARFERTLNSNTDTLKRVGRENQQLRPYAQAMTVARDGIESWRRGTISAEAALEAIEKRLELAATERKRVDEAISKNRL